MTRKILIVGGGIVGAALAHRLADEGARVTLLESGEAASGVTGKAFAWINANAGDGGPYAALRREAIPAWRALQRELGPALSIDWCGALTWDGDPEATVAAAESRRAEGQSIALLERRAIEQLEPGLTAPPPLALYAAEEGALDPIETTRSLLAAAGEKGAEVRTGQRVTALLTKGRRVCGVQLQEGRLEADLVVLAAGLGAVSLCSALDIDLPLQASPSIWLAFDTERDLLRSIVSGPAFEARQGGPRRLLAAEDFLAEDGENSPAEVAKRAEAALTGGLRRSAGLQLADFAVGQRPMPRDRLPILGPPSGVEGLYLSVMHSGITLAALAARLAAEEILVGRSSPLADPFRLARFSV